MSDEELKLNIKGNRRGMQAKKTARNWAHALGQALRACDSKVGKFLRINEPDKYNETLEKADAPKEKTNAPS